MSDKNNMELALELLESAELSIQSAKQLLGAKSGTSKSKKAIEHAMSTLSQTAGSGGQIIEGIFNGECMIGSDSKSYPVPANYASKSKLIPGDKLKLTIDLTGRFIFKQIGPIARKQIVGKLMYDNDGNYRVLAEGKSYQVLTASVTYFKANIGDILTVIVPEAGDSDWAAIENSLPKSAIDNSEESDKDKFDLNTF